MRYLPKKHLNSCSLKTGHFQVSWPWRLLTNDSTTTSYFNFSQLHVRPKPMRIARGHLVLFRKININLDYYLLMFSKRSPLSYLFLFFFLLSAPGERIDLVFPFGGELFIYTCLTNKEVVFYFLEFSQEIDNLKCRCFAHPIICK